MWLSLILVGIFCTALAYVEAALISSMPRSGGDYIFQSRILSGGIGYVNVFVFVIIMQTIWNGSVAWWAADHAIAPFFVIFGAMLNNPALTNAGLWMKSGNGFMLLGTIIVVWAAIINLVGMVWYRRAQKVCFYVGIVGLAVMILMFLTTTQAAFEQGFNNFCTTVFALEPGMYQNMMTIAQANGYSPSPNVGWESFVVVIPLAMTFMFMAWSCYNAGEIKGAGGFKSQILQVVVAEIVAIIIGLVLYTSIAHMVGDSWYKATAWTFWNHGSAYPLPVAPYFGFLGAMIFSNPIPILVIFITLQAWFWMWYTNITVAVSRTMLAMAFDREFPEKIADVHARTRAPWIAILVVCFFGIIAVALYAYTSFSSLILAASLVSIIGFAGSALAAAVMPWRRKELYKSSPIAKYEIGKIPTITIAGVIWLAFTAVVIYIFATEARVFFVSGWVAWAYLIGMYVVAALFYFAYKFYRQREGIKVELLYKQIPVE
jgi:amino acid transporter